MQSMAAGRIHTDLALETKEKFEEVEENVWIAKTAKVAKTAFIAGPCIIDEEAEIRHCAFIRGNAIVGKGAVVGNSTELKNVILFNKVQVPHYNYVGDSILGYRSHMGAGSITSNVKSDKKLVIVKCNGAEIETGLKKFGAMLGDNVEVGCGSVLNPGTVTKHCRISGRESLAEFPLQEGSTSTLRQNSIFPPSSAIIRFIIINTLSHTACSRGRKNIPTPYSPAGGNSAPPAICLRKNSSGN